MWRVKKRPETVLYALSVLFQLFSNVFKVAVDWHYWSTDPMRNLTIAEKREHIKSAFLFAWNGYTQASWGADEHRPISNTSANSRNGWGATLIDALDTLHLMGLNKEFNQARDFVAQIQWGHTTHLVQVFETTIRYVGGLISAYELSGDRTFLIKAVELTDRLMPAFDSPTGIPYQNVNFTTNKAVGSDFKDGGSVLSEFGTLQLELTRLSQLTGNKTYHKVGQRVYDALEKIRSSCNGLYPNFISPETAEMTEEFISWGAMGDSFYEYLVKQYVFSRGRDVRMKEMAKETIRGMMGNLLSQSQSRPELVYLADFRDGEKKLVMGELACFAPGALLLASRHIPGLADVEYVADSLMSSCINAWRSTHTGLAPEVFGWIDMNGTLPVDKLTRRQKWMHKEHGVLITHPTYVLRPETIESLFYFYRLKKDNKEYYRDMAWDMFLAIERYCRQETGYSGVKNVDTRFIVGDDTQESFFFAETLKYLYLMFEETENEQIPLDKWVFNTEAHPIRIK